MGNKNSGRPSKYQNAGGDDYVPDIAKQLTLLGSTEKEIGAFKASLGLG